MSYDGYLEWSPLLVELGLLTKQPSERFEADGKQLLEAYRANKADYGEFVTFSSKGYTKNLVTELGDRANVIVMGWSPGQMSAFHSHEGARCLVKVLRGAVVEERVTLEATSQASLVSKRKLVTNEVAYIDDAIGCHMVRNESLVEPAITLHIYSPPYRSVRVFKNVNHITDRVLALGLSKIMPVQFDNNTPNKQRPKSDSLDVETEL